MKIDIDNMPSEVPERFRRQLTHTRVALIDMDGVLYDTMKYHTLAWQQMMAEVGVLCSRNEFYLYEGMTGKDTINLIWRRTYGKDCGPENIKRLYARKSYLFNSQGKREPMPAASDMIRALRDRGVLTVLVTGSGQHSIIDAVDRDYPGAFPVERRVTAADVVHGKPDAEPYLKGLEIAGFPASDAIVIENAPLGVKAGKAAGVFTIAVTTGPIPAEEFHRAGADIVFPDMVSLADFLNTLAM
ncbi:MAG: HAD-IA family hydrolase [Clostridium sp.]|nr:HAD-IA family hydrolase [Prevotella sp.]MCM1429009.1 HAD-IA family hydrolase [Clostridium sp.]MCM1475461.1 HAD-IA family hydrolase [Muribaculaceae bacterium]